MTIDGPGHSVRSEQICPSDKTTTIYRRSGSFESLEERRVFSAQALAEVAIETQDLPTAIQDEILAHVESTALLQDIHQETGASYVDQQYGFDGAGQTVAIIDSGIAFDHVALGGGFGPDSRVVGGYDFAEGDSNPFDCLLYTSDAADE